jgi:hypothetical protein
MKTSHIESGIAQEAAQAETMRDEPTGKKQLVIAGIVTEVCVAFPALSAREEGFDVFVCSDASGTFNKTTREAAWSRMEQVGCQLMTWFGVACELHRAGAMISRGWARFFESPPELPLPYRIPCLEWRGGSQRQGGSRRRPCHIRP